MTGRTQSVALIVRIVVLRVFLLVCVLIAGCIVFANTMGIPAPILKNLLTRVNKGRYAVIVDRVKLKGVNSLLIDDVSVYRKHVLGKPLLNASKAIVDFNFLSCLLGKSAITSLLVDGAVLRPKQGKGSHSYDHEESDKEYSFPVNIKNGQLYDLRIKNLKFQFNKTGKTIVLSSINADVNRGNYSGKVNGKLSYNRQKKRVDGKLVTRLDPHAVQTLVSEYNIHFVGKLIKRLQFTRERPRVEFAFFCDLVKKGDIYLSGDFRTRNGSYRGVEFKRADGLFTVSRQNSKLKAELNRLFVVRDEGTANVSFVADPYKKTLDFEAESTLHPMAMARAVGVLTNLLSKQIEFKGDSYIKASGIADYSVTHSNTDLKAEVRADNIAIKPLQCDSGSLNIQMKHRNVTITNIEATAYNGTVLGNIGLEIPLKDKSQPKVKKTIPYKLNLSLNDADFAVVMKSISSKKQKKPYNGRMSVDLNISGMSGKNLVSSMNGKGACRISDGRVFMLPLFGGLTKFMTKIIPGLDFVLRQSDLKTKFEIKNGLISTDKVAMEGDLFSLKAFGSYMLKGNLDFDVQIKLLKAHTLSGDIVRFITFPISKLFEFSLKGSLDDPHWYPQNFSLDLLEKIGFDKRK